jgi:predicted RecA/RadA family phage recombinase
VNNFVQPGNVLTVVAPVGGVVADQLVFAGSIVGVATCTAAAGAQVEVAVEGVFDLAKVPADALVGGSIAKADATGHVAAAGTKDIGWVVNDAAAGSTTARVRLCPGIA